MNEILGTIGELASAELDYDGDLELGMRLVEDLELDSIRLLTLATAVEDHFRIMLDEEDEMSIETVGDLVNLVARKLAQRKAAEAPDGGAGT